MAKPPKLPVLMTISVVAIAVVALGLIEYFITRSDRIASRDIERLDTSAGAEATRTPEQELADLQKSLSTNPAAAPATTRRGAPAGTARAADSALTRSDGPTGRAAGGPPRSLPAPGVLPPMPAETGRRGAPPGRPSSARVSLYLPGQVAYWNPYEIQVTAPLLLQAGGQIRAASRATGPNGIDLTSRDGSTDGLVAPAMPYLALLGRVCSRVQCTDPFVVGTRSIVCPAIVGGTGTLQLWTNNLARGGSREGFPGFSGTTGGFSIYAEPAPATSCSAAGSAQAFSGQNAAALDAGETLDWPEFTVTSGQNAWKPFFLPLDRPLRIRASGQMRPQQNLDPTGPDGIRVTAALWSYPGSGDITIDADHPLFAPGLPFQALIGRVCGRGSCSAPFLVGREHVVCADEAHRDRLELWLNQIVERQGLLGQDIPMSLSALQRQQRVGSYRFTVASAPQSACQ
jgi:hypothetical protein